MPKDTFLNLPEWKRRRVFDAAVDEFAAHRFSDSSINRIVKTAGIPRGSFYQYFNDKEDIYLFVMQEMSKEKVDVFNESQLASLEDASFFDLMLEAMPAILSWGDEHPRYVEIAVQMIQDDSDFARRIVGNLASSQRFFIEFMQREQERGHIRADVDLYMLTRMFMTMALELFRSYCTESHEQFMSQLKAMFDILYNGVKAEGK